MKRLVLQMDNALDRLSMDDQEEPYIQDPTDPTRFSQSQVCHILIPLTQHYRARKAASVGLVVSHCLVAGMGVVYQGYPAALASATGQQHKQVVCQPEHGCVADFGSECFSMSWCSGLSCTWRAIKSSTLAVGGK